MMTAYYVRQPGETHGEDGLYLEPGFNLFTGGSDLEALFDDLTSLEHDLLLLAASVFAADRGTARGEREEFLERTISLSIPIVNVLGLQPMVPAIERILRFLSDDSWEIQFRQVIGIPEPATEWPDHDGATLLLSGGLDSFSGAIELLGSGRPTNLVSHVTRNRQTKESQIALVNELASAGMPATHYVAYVSSGSKGPDEFDHDIESSQRTRSFVFLIMAAIVARRTGFRDLVVMAENGQFAIHLPLSDARIGAFSTHTAHPEFLDRMQKFLSAVLGIPLSVVNPFLYETKAEVVKRAVDQLPGAIPATTSCWMSARVKGALAHCGECIPCLMRRIAVDTHGPDATGYQRDMWAENIGQLEREDTGRRNIVELAEFAVRVSSLSNEEFVSAFPELISRYFDRQEVISMYKRFAAEAISVLQAHPNLASLL